MQNKQLDQSIEEGISKGVPLEFIAYSLMRAGWPQHTVVDAIDQWRKANGRFQQTTAFKDWLKKYYRQARPAIGVMVFLNLIADMITLLQPWPLKILADSVFGNSPAPGPLRQYTHTPTLILIVSLMTLAIFVLSRVFGIVKDYFLLKIGYWLNRTIKEESFRHILHLPLYHEARLPKGDYIYRQNEVTSSLSDLVLNATSTIIGSVILMLGVAIIMLLLNAKLTLVTFIVIPFLILSVRIFSPIMAKWGQAFAILASDAATLIAESIDNSEMVQAFTLEERQVTKLINIWQDTYEVARKGLIWNKLFDFTNGFLVVIGTSTVMFFGGSAALNGHFTLGKLFIFMTYMGFLIGPIQEITNQITIRRQKKVNVRRIYQVLCDHEGIEYVRQDKRLPQVRGAIEFQNVSYSYGGTMILDEVSMTIQAGEKIGIIGPSGAGKSTLLKLLDLYLEPDRGRILLDGVDIQSVSMHDLRRNIAWISQSPQVFAASIINNMRDGDADRVITPEEIAWATQAANVSEFVDKLPMGLDTPIGESGSSLSGGQRQRISIARALVKNAPIICMDEPTSALDDKSEKMVKQSIGLLIKDKTVLLVTHRLPLLSLMDKVYVLKDSKLVDANTLGGVGQYLYQLEMQS